MRRGSDLGGFALVLLTVAAGELLAQWMVQRPWMAQLLSPGGGLGTLVVVGAALMLRIFVVVVLPGLLVARVLWRRRQSSTSRSRR